MDALQERVLADLEQLNSFARRVLRPTHLPAAGTWVRCWNLRLEEPVGDWHILSSTDHDERVTYLCDRLGIVTVLSALRAPHRFAIHERDEIPDESACWRCLLTD